MGLFSLAAPKSVSPRRSDPPAQRGRLSLRVSTPTPPQPAPAPPPAATPPHAAASSQPCRFLASSKKLGSGAYGSVLAGVDVATEDAVAIKFIADGRMKPASLEREIKMLRMLGQCNHPSLLRFYGHVRPEEARAGAVRAAHGAAADLPMPKPLGECHALVMEAVDGGEVFEYVVKCGGLSEAEAGPIIAQLIDAVGAAHHLGIAHRDLKLENVLLAGPATANAADKLFGASTAADGAPQRIKLIDWGLAHQHAMAASGVPIKEKLHSRCGSRSYMAPEVTNRDISGTIGYDAFAADVWSLGVCLFAMVLGFFPFEQANPANDWRARRAAEAQASGGSTVTTIFGFYPEKADFEVSPALHALLDRMLLFDPSRRATLAEVCDSEWIAPFAGWMTSAHLRHAGIDLEKSTTSSEVSTSSSCSSSSRHTRSSSGGWTVDLVAAGGDSPVRARYAATARAHAAAARERQDSESTLSSASSGYMLQHQPLPIALPASLPLPPPPPSPLSPSAADAVAAAAAAGQLRVLPEKRLRTSDDMLKDVEPQPTVVVAGGRQIQRAEMMRGQVQRHKGLHKVGAKSAPNVPLHPMPRRKPSIEYVSSSRRLATLLSKTCIKVRSVHAARRSRSVDESGPDSPRFRRELEAGARPKITGRL